MGLPEDVKNKIAEQRKMISESAAYIKAKLPLIPRVVVELGTGQGDLAKSISQEVIIPYQTIPHFKPSTAPHHVGQLVFGKVEGKNVLIMQGRLHHYEGYTLQEVTYPIRVFHALGIEILVVCNGGGSVNPNYRVGELMLIKDHINLLWGNPLVGPNDLELGPKFVDMTDAYSPRLRSVARRFAANNDITLHEGVYVANIGPTFETPAETMMAYRMGGDLVGMSTVPEVIVARHMGMEVVGISQVGNRAAGLHQGNLDEAGEEQEFVLNPGFEKLVLGLLAEIL